MKRFLRAFLNRSLGESGERAAERFVRRKGMRILVRGYSTHCGEIDLIARDGDTLVFIEVKTRRWGVPAEAVGPEKQKRITLAAMHFLRRHRALEVRARFDILSVIWPEGTEIPTIEHALNAFEAVGIRQMHR